MTRDEAIRDIKRLRDNVATDADQWVYEDVLELVEDNVPMRFVRAYIVEQRAILESALVRAAYLNVAAVVGRVREGSEA